MNMRIDPYTGEKFDADQWYRGPNGIWVNREDERRHREACANYIREKRSRRNESRVRRGLRKRSNKDFARSENTYEEWRKLDTDLDFGEWLREKSKRSVWCKEV